MLVLSSGGSRSVTAVYNGYGRNPPIPHGEWLDLIAASLADFGYAPGRRLVSTTRDGRDGVGALEVARHDGSVPDDAAVWLGFTNANSTRRVSRMYAGLLDGHGVVMDRYPHWRASGPVTLRSYVDDCVARFAVQIDSYRRRVSVMRRSAVDDALADHLMLEAARRKLLSWSYMSRMDALLRSGGSVWDLLKAFAVAAAGSPPISYNPLTDQFHRMWRFKKMLERSKK